ncbi:MAG TPA: hypothetical protein DIS98_02100 [Colwellia sp.]|nr:hypothetical protein [Colwellia sp.]
MHSANTNKSNKSLNGTYTDDLLIWSCAFLGGFSYMLLATLAGFLYGLVYLSTGKIWYAILTYFLFNMVHLVLFTYPLLKV